MQQRSYLGDRDRYCGRFSDVTLEQSSSTGRCGGFWVVGPQACPSRAPASSVRRGLLVQPGLVVLANARAVVLHCSWYVTYQQQQRSSRDGLGPCGNADDIVCNCVLCTPMCDRCSQSLIALAPRQSLRLCWHLAWLLATFLHKIFP